MFLCKAASIGQSCLSGTNLFTAVECGAKTWQAAALFLNTLFELLQAQVWLSPPALSRLKHQTSALQLIREKVKPPSPPKLYIQATDNRRLQESFFAHALSIVCARFHN